MAQVFLGMDMDMHMDTCPARRIVCKTQTHRVKICLLATSMPKAFLRACILTEGCDDFVLPPIYLTRKLRLPPEGTSGGNKKTTALFGSGLTRKWRESIAARRWRNQNSAVDMSQRDCSAKHIGAREYRRAPMAEPEISSGNVPK